MQSSLASAMLFLAVLLCSACTPQYTQNVVQEIPDYLQLRDKVYIERQQQWRLSSHTPLYIAMAKNDLVPRTELTITESLYDALLEQFPLSRASSNPATLGEALASARLMRMPITVYHQLSLMDDQLSSWREYDQDMDSGKSLGRDRLRLQIQLYDSYSGKLLDSAILNSVSRRIAWSEITPVELLRQASAQYAQQLAMVSPQ
ncbi:DUF4823 domain-containing protein [Pseudoteredinibacter isoporae]|uniref:DUF3313 domain-containing protein n=1 Tax=Pseudoteredinibacter isoporae TaxID=570281 RepID=A0A7X0JUF6_9GAMM|nr:DUF4823 domain-containing protein [Pseudoteredinibacter isoporae]MBB6521526.1 hypothetical protein [Pseudoteredinibacter isoporae]NHO87080.1 DUF4823 domain-containing protein [Pseudoteredinibacter isoporae]NIB22827.1 DUF4823 domain-containing protein [Pseudoteredinibacter isoporae]